MPSQCAQLLFPGAPSRPTQDIESASEHYCSDGVVMPGGTTSSWAQLTRSRLALAAAVVALCAVRAANVETVIDARVDVTQPAVRFDGIGGLSGGGATSTFVDAYDDASRSEILDWLFKPGFAVGLDILKVEMGADDQTTDGCEACHMRSPTEVNCTRGYGEPAIHDACGVGVVLHVEDSAAAPAHTYHSSSSRPLASFWLTSPPACSWHHLDLCFLLVKSGR